MSERHHLILTLLKVKIEIEKSSALNQWRKFRKKKVVKAAERRKMLHATIHLTSGLLQRSVRIFRLAAARRASERLSVYALSKLSHTKLSF